MGRAGSPSFYSTIDTASVGAIKLCLGAVQALCVLN
jgi:hypothetical protein